MYHIWVQMPEMDTPAKPARNGKPAKPAKPAKHPGRRRRVFQVIPEVSSATNPNYPVTGDKKSDNRISGAFGYRSIANHYADALRKRLPNYDDGLPVKMLVLECDDRNCNYGAGAGGACRDIRPGIERERRAKLVKQAAEGGGAG